MRDEAYAINLNEYDYTGIHWVAYNFKNSFGLVIIVSYDCVYFLLPFLKINYYLVD